MAWNSDSEIPDRFRTINEADEIETWDATEHTRIECFSAKVLENSGLRRVFVNRAAGLVTTLASSSSTDPQQRLQLLFVDRGESHVKRVGVWTHTCEVCDLTCTPDTMRCLAACEDGVIRIFDSITLLLLGEMNAGVPANSDYGSGLYGIACTSDWVWAFGHRRNPEGSDLYEIMRFDLRRLDSSSSMELRVEDTAFVRAPCSMYMSLDETTCVVIYPNYEWEAWDVRDFKRHDPVMKDKRPYMEVWSVINSKLMYARFRNQLCLVDIATGKCLLTVQNAGIPLIRNVEYDAGGSLQFIQLVAFFSEKFVTRVTMGRLTHFAEHPDVGFECVPATKSVVESEDGDVIFESRGRDDLPVVPWMVSDDVQRWWKDDPLDSLDCVIVKCAAFYDGSK
jgi:hypothetical protein